MTHPIERNFAGTCGIYDTRTWLIPFKAYAVGLTNAAATFQRLVDIIFRADLEFHVFVYLDDVIVLTSDFETHLEILHKVLDRFLASGFILSLEKCHFYRPQLKYLGYIVDKESFREDSERLSP